MILAHLLCALPLATPGTPDEDKAGAALETAELRYEQGRYKEAQVAYSRLAKKYPGTKAGRIAASRCLPSGYLGSKLIVDNGPSSNRVDIALMGDGYTLGHQDTFDKLADDVTPLFERQKTFREYFSYLNFRRFNLVSADDGVDGFGREEDTALNGRTLGTIQGHVGVDSKLVFSMLDQCPEHDGLAIVYVRVGALGTGGNGVATIGGRSAKITVHEWGHAFGRLGDEYAQKTHDRGGVREAVNVSSFEDEERVPWAHFIEAKVPGVGVYEGAAGQVRDAFKPTSGGCVMASGEFFCPPCREALVLRIYSIVDPIDSASPEPQERSSGTSLTLEDSLEFEVQAMVPAKHMLEASWYVLPESRAPQNPRGLDRRYARRTGDRRGRGPLSMIKDEPWAESRGQRDGLHEFKLRRKDLEPGRYRVVCRVRDTTEFRGERHPWVLQDEHGLLESERAWWVVVPED